MCWDSELSSDYDLLSFPHNTYVDSWLDSASSQEEVSSMQCVVSNSDILPPSLPPPLFFLL